MNRESIRNAIEYASERGYPCGERDCGVFECEITQAAIDALALLNQTGDTEALSP